MDKKPGSMESHRFYVVVGIQPENREYMTFDFQEDKDSPQQAMLGFWQSDGKKPQSDGWVLRTIPFGPPEKSREAIRDLLVACYGPSEPGLLSAKVDQFAKRLLDSLKVDGQDDYRLGTGIPLEQSKWGRSQN